MRALCAAAPKGCAQFSSALEGGTGGEQHNALCDGFVYSQMQAQGENSALPRAVGKTVPVAALPSLLRGLGVHPTQWEEDLIAGEAESAAAGGGGGLSLPDVMRLYINARPVRGVSRGDVAAALSDAAAAAGLGGGSSGGGVKWGELEGLLRSQGELLSGSDLNAYMATLLGSEEGCGSALLTRQLGGRLLRSRLVGGGAARTAPVPGVLLGSGAAGTAAAGGARLRGVQAAPQKTLALPRVAPPADLTAEQLLSPDTFANLLCRPAA